MKKLLMLILIGLLLALSIFIVLQGFEVGNVEILAYAGIQDRNKQLDETIQQASKLADKDFKQAVSSVQDTSKQLEKVKKEYEDLTVVSSEGDIQASAQIERYEIETLWVKLGNYATSEGAIVKIDIVQGNTSGTYNLKFTVNGSYIAITDYISDIENDSTLGFKIEEFKMIPSGNELQATFICKDIAIKEISGTGAGSSNTGSGNSMSNGNNMGNGNNNTTSTGNTNSNTNSNTNNTASTMGNAGTSMNNTNNTSNTMGTSITQ